MEFHVMRIGTLEADLSWMVAMARPATINSKNRAAAWVKWPVLSFLVKHPQGILLFDTGCYLDSDGKTHRPENFEKAFPYYVTEEERITTQLAKLNLTPADVDIVLLSHLHEDHAGNVGLFMNSKIIIHAAEYADALVTTHKDPSYSGGYIKSQFDIEGLRYELIEEDTEILPGIKAITLPGHTNGTLGLMVRLNNTGTIICTSDAAYCKQNFGPPARMSGVLHDSISYMKSIEKIRKLQNIHNATIIFGHDQQQYENDLRKSPEFYT